MIIWHKNSFWASIVSIAGSACAMIGIYGFVDGDVGSSIALIAIGLVVVYLGHLISDAKAFKTWWKQVEKANLVPQIAQSKEVAVAIYNKNPDKRTLKKIEQLNPDAAACIRSMGVQ